MLRKTWPEAPGPGRPLVAGQAAAPRFLWEKHQAGESLPFRPVCSGNHSATEKKRKDDSQESPSLGLGRVSRPDRETGKASPWPVPVQGA